MLTRKQNDEVLFAEEAVRAFSLADAEELGRRALASPIGKLRICLHRSPDAELHEMLVALRRDVRYPPHKNLRSEETHCVLLGEATLCLYANDGRETKRVELGGFGSERPSYSRIPVDTYHALEIESEVCVFLETKLGPFMPESNVPLVKRPDADKVVAGKTLIIGADGIIGRNLTPWLRSSGVEVIETTRRCASHKAERVFLDLLRQDEFDIPADTRCAIVLAAATDYKQCEIDPVSAQINLVEVPRLVARLLEAGIFTVFTSTVVVFGGANEYPKEDDLPHPTNAYGRQKAEGEKIIGRHALQNNLMENLAIVRITKSIDSQTRPMPEWVAQWKRGEVVKPFMDLYFSPMTLEYICSGFAEVVAKRANGVFHLSGAENINYAEFCHRLAARLGVPACLVKPVRSRDVRVNLLFAPAKGASLSMQATTARLGMAAQPVSEVTDELERDFGDINRRLIHA